MKKYRFEDLCKKAEQGYIVSVRNPSEGKTADVLCCSLDHMEVYTNDAKRECWDFHQCEEITGRTYPQEDKWEGFSK